MKIMEKCKNFIVYLWPGSWIGIVLYLLTEKNNKTLIQKDIERYLEEYNSQKFSIQMLIHVLFFFKPSRSVFCFRMAGSTFKYVLARVFLRPLSTIEIGKDCEIGGGFRIYHNFSVILVDVAGENLTVNQGVTIGKK